MNVALAMRLIVRMQAYLEVANDAEIRERLALSVTAEEWDELVAELEAHCLYAGTSIDVTGMKIRGVPVHRPGRTG